MPRSGALRWRVCAERHTCVLSLWQQYLDNRCCVIDTAPLRLAIRFGFIWRRDMSRCSLVTDTTHETKNEHYRPGQGKRIRATVKSLEPFWKVEIFATRIAQRESTYKGGVLGKREKKKKKKKLGAAPVSFSRCLLQQTLLTQKKDAMWTQAQVKGCKCCSQNRCEPLFISVLLQ